MKTKNPASHNLFGAANLQQGRGIALINLFLHCLPLITCLGLFSGGLAGWVRGAEATAIKPESYPHRFLISDMVSSNIAIIERNGDVSWEYPQPGFVMDGERLTNGNVIYCWFSGGKQKQAGVREVTPGKKIAFEYKIEQECHSVQRLANGLTLIEDPAQKRLIEVDVSGKIVHELKLQIGHDQVHHIARQCRKLPNGNYLVCQENDQKVVEYAPDGTIVKTIRVTGLVYSATFLPNGNTLIGTGGGKDMGRSVIEFDPDGKKVWSFDPENFPPDTNLDWVLGVQRLSNGNTVIANFLGHGKEGKGISLLEVTPEKKVVWTSSKKRIVLLMQVLPEEK